VKEKQPDHAINSATIITKIKRHLTQFWLKHNFFINYIFGLWERSG